MPKSIAAVVAARRAITRCRQGRSAQPRNLDIDWVDVEGGAATLVVSPSGESLLIDSGWEVGDRDAKRIHAAAQRAGLTKIDYFILSHFHADHAGGLVALAKLMPIGHCFDRGDFIEPANQKWRDNYLSVCGSKRTILKAGDRIPIKGLQVDIVASDGQLIAQPVNGGGQANPLCATAENKPKDVPENQLMVGALVSYGKFTFLDLADLDWEKEMEFTCPVNRLGQISIWQAGRHGALDGAGAPGFLYAVKPQVVVVNNGPRKGLGGPSPGAELSKYVHYERIAKTPDIEGDLAGAPVAARQGAQRPRVQHREPRGHRRLPGPHHPGVGFPERDVHGDEHTERVGQDVHGTRPGGDSAGARGPGGARRHVLRRVVRRGHGVRGFQGCCRAQAVSRGEPRARRVHPLRHLRAGGPARTLRALRSLARRGGVRRAGRVPEAAGGRAGADSRERLRPASVQDDIRRAGAAAGEQPGGVRGVARGRRARSPGRRHAQASSPKPAAWKTATSGSTSCSTRCARTISRSSKRGATRRRFDAHVAAAHTRQIATNAPCDDGSPLDERVYKAIE